ncbi:hypothetical protein PVAND_001149 [Polypedilum vanderplanki]|uniref:Ubiquinone biosynthesis monooxygenase COQ6 n=1 Tax=Polypedilum vanderplanki TaxID=319348 RepID=A0A9J6BMG9_POLVA|nr:hypothetical protein PVAND_001149 [Polypedilum vanderplanki]
MLLLKNTKQILKQNSLCLLRHFSAIASIYDTNHYDIVIAGGGLVGIGLAASLAKNETLSDKKILLLEGAPKFKAQTREAYSNRVSAINKQSIRLLKTIDAWDFIESIRVKPIMQMLVWDGITDEVISFNHPNFNENVACIVENDLMLEGMYMQIEKLLNVHIKNESRLESCLLPKDSKIDQTVITLNSGEKFTCDLLVSCL